MVKLFLKIYLPVNVTDGQIDRSGYLLITGENYYYYYYYYY